MKRGWSDSALAKHSSPLFYMNFIEGKKRTNYLPRFFVQFFVCCWSILEKGLGGFQVRKYIWKGNQAIFIFSCSICCFLHVAVGKWWWCGDEHEVEVTFFVEKGSYFYLELWRFRSGGASGVPLISIPFFTFSGRRCARHVLYFPLHHLLPFSSEKRSDEWSRKERRVDPLRKCVLSGGDIKEKGDAHTKEIFIACNESPIRHKLWYYVSYINFFMCVSTSCLHTMSRLQAVFMVWRTSRIKINDRRRDSIVCVWEWVRHLLCTVERLLLQFYWDYYPFPGCGQKKPEREKRVQRSFYYLEMTSCSPQTFFSLAGGDHTHSQRKTGVKTKDEKKL